MDIKQEAALYHLEKKGKIEISNKAEINNMRDLTLAYTPGVAGPCELIAQDVDKVYDYTFKNNSVAVISDGTRVLGLGNIGPEAALPVMEGKAALFKRFAGVDAIPICIRVESAEEFIAVAKAVSPTFGGINLEDISMPNCFDVEDTLKEELNIPVFHDDQHGTAVVAAAGVIGGLRLVGKRIEDVKVVLNGAGAAGTAIAKLLLSMGVKDLAVCNQSGLLNVDNPRLNRVQRELAEIINPEKRVSNLKEVSVGADVLLGVSAAGAFDFELLNSLAKDSIVFAMANPVPETSYEVATQAGVRVFGTGKSGDPNQINNVLVFPGMFRGALDVRAREINETMKVAAVYAIANIIPESELKEGYIIPDPFDERVAPAVAAAVAKAAIDTNVARIIMDPEEVREECLRRVKASI